MRARGRPWSINPPTPASRPRSNRCIKTQKYLINKVPEVTRTFARVGTSEVATDPMSPGEYDLYVFYKPQSEWRKENGKPVSRDRLAELVREELAKEVPEQDYDFAQPIQMRFNEMLEGSRADLAVRIFGDDYDTMEKIAGEVKTILEGIEGTRQRRVRKPGPRARARNPRGPCLRCSNTTLRLPK
jgi:cobalt-zinc-cadmium resistance protein CzcA